MNAARRQWLIFIVEHIPTSRVTCATSKMSEHDKACSSREIQRGISRKWRAGSKYQRDFASHAERVLK